MKAFYYIYHIALTLLGCFLLFLVGVFYLGSDYQIFAEAGGRTITRRLRVKTFLLESVVFAIDILVTLHMWAVSVPDGMIGIGDDDFYFLKEISATDSTVRYQLLDEMMILVLDADFRKPALGMKVERDSLRRFNNELIPNGMELRDGTILPVIKVYDGYMKDVIQ